MGGSNEVIDEPLVEPASAIIFYPSSLAVCLVSGGMDSCVTAAIASDENDELAFLHVSYGQLSERRDRRAFDEFAFFYQVGRRLAVSVDYLGLIGGSSLTDKTIPVTTASLSAQGIVLSVSEEPPI